MMSTRGLAWVHVASQSVTRFTAFGLLIRTLVGLAVGNIERGLLLGAIVGVVVGPIVGFRVRNALERQLESSFGPPPWVAAVGRRR